MQILGVVFELILAIQIAVKRKEREVLDG